MEVLVWLVMLLLATSRYAQGHSLDYEYLPHNDEQYVGRTRTVHMKGVSFQQGYDANIKKCRCGGGEVWDGKGCSEAQTYVAVTNPNTNQVIASQTNAFRVTVGEVRCSLGQDVKITLDPNRGHSDQFSLLPNGSLYWKRHPYENYCFDHTLDKEGKPNSWEAQVCLPPPVVPRCCHSVSTVSNGSCNTYSTQRFSPSVMVNGLELQWPGEVMDKSVKVKCEEYENLMTVPLNTHEANLTYESDVSLVWLPVKATQNIQEEEYCVEPEMEGQNYIASFCYADQTDIHQHLCSSGTCVRKCCPEKEIMDADCIPVMDNTELLGVPTFIDANDLKSSVGPPENLSWLYGLPQCNLFLLEPDVKEDKFFLLNNGKLFRPYLQETFPPSHYCIDNFVIAGEQPHTKALVCFPEEVIETVCSTVELKVYPALLLVSSIFLGITLVVYISVPDIRDKLHGRCLISLVAALFVAYTLLATTRLAYDKLPKSLCSFLGSLTQLSVLAAFFWLNVMCFDIWRTLRKTRTMVDGGRAGRRRFLLYSLYAWGCPLLITVVAVIMANLPPSHDVIRPNFSRYCWFGDETTHWLYLYGWMLALVLANVIFFSLVATILCKAQNDPLLKRSREYNRERMWLYAKLFLVMGVTWLAEVVSWQAGACKAMVVTDTLNALQGLILFLVFICKRTTLNKVRERCGCAGKVMGGPLTTLTSSLSSFSTTSSVSRKRDSSLSASVRSSPQIRRSSASPNTKARNTPSAVPLQTLQEAPDEPSEFSRGGLPETAIMTPKKDREADTESGTAEETTPLTTTNSTSPSRPLETHFVN